MSKGLEELTAEIATLTRAIAPAKEYCGNDELVKNKDAEILKLEKKHQTQPSHYDLGKIHTAVADREQRWENFSSKEEETLNNDCERRTDQTELVVENGTTIQAQADEAIESMREQYAMSDAKLATDITHHEETLAAGLKQIEEGRVIVSRAIANGNSGANLPLAPQQATNASTDGVE